MFLSIVIPVYNGESFLREAVQSVTSQPCTDLEIIICDDGSNDRTEKICRELKAQDHRVRYYQKNNTGVSDTRNFGLQHATGDYVAFLDADDGWKQDFYTTEIRQSIICHGMPDIVSFGQYWCGATLQEIKQIHIPDECETSGTTALNKCWGHHGAAFYRTSFLREGNCYYPKSFSYFEDFIFKMCATYLAKSVLILPFALYLYRNNPASVMHNSNDFIFYKQYLLAFDYTWKKLQELAFSKKESVLCDRITHAFTQKLIYGSFILSYRTWKKQVVESDIMQLLIESINKGMLERKKDLEYAALYPFLFYIRKRIPMRFRMLYRKLRNKLRK